MRVIIINGGFFPAKHYGGPVISIDNLCTLLKDEIDFYIICNNHELGCKERLSGIREGWNDRGNCKVRYLASNSINYNTLTKIIGGVQPDAIYINSLFDAKWTLNLLRIAKKNKIKVLLAPRGQLCKNAFVRKYKKIPFLWFLKMFQLLDNVCFQSTSEEETETIKRYLNGTDNNIYFLTNLPSIPKKELKHPIKFAGKGKFVFYSRIVPKKNLINAINFFNEVKGEAQFDIFGPIEDKSYWKECQKEITKLPKNVSVSYKGVIDHDSVFDVLAEYDAFLFPTWSENFGHVISEALFSECPAIISDQTPWRNLEKYGAGWDIPLNDCRRFKESIEIIIDSDSIQHLEMRKNAKLFAINTFDLNELKVKYLKAFQ